MNLAEFQISQKQTTPPSGLSLALQALWFDAKGDWNKAHEFAQKDDGPPGDWVHAYLHRKEGDASNARYWYIRAGKPVYPGSLEEEWAAISEALLANACERRFGEGQSRPAWRRLETRGAARAPTPL